MKKATKSRAIERSKSNRKKNIPHPREEVKDFFVVQKKEEVEVSVSKKIKVISIGTDRRVFEEGSAVRKRLLKQRELFEELHVIVFSRYAHNLHAEQNGNLWLYPTSSLSRLLYVRDAVVLARALIKQREMNVGNTTVTVQDPFECALAGSFVSKRAGLPLHIQIHTDFLNPVFENLSFQNRIRVFLAKYIIPSASGIRTVSERVRTSLEKSGLKIRGEISVLPVFSEQALVWTSKPLRRFKKEENHLSFVLMPARLALEKDFKTALASLQHAIRGGGEMGLVIVGEGPEEKNVRKEIADRELESLVKLELWQSNLSSLYRVSDMVLATSLFEGFGLVLLEASAHGKPVVTTDVGIARELIKEPYERFVCPVGDIECIANRLRELAGDAKLQREYGDALRARAKEFVIPEAEYWQRYRYDLERCVVKKDDRPIS